MEIITAYIIQFLLVVSLIGYGFYFAKFLNIENAGISSEKLPLILFMTGLLPITFFAVSANFFMPIKPLYSIIILSIGLLLFYIKSKELKNSFNLKFISVFSITLAIISIISLLYGFKAFDTGAYHIQAVKWIVEDIVPLGIANLLPNLGYNSLSFSTLSITDFFLFLVNRNLYILYPAWFSLFLSCIILSFKNKKYGSDFFFILCILPIFMQSRSFGSFAPDNAVLIYILITLYLYKFLYEKGRSEKSKNSLETIITLFASFTFTLKLSAAPICLIPITLLTYKLIKKIKLSKSFCFSATISIFFVIMFFAKSYMLSGYPAYPHYAFKIDTEWSVPTEKPNLEREYISNYPKHDLRALDREYIKSWKWFPRYLLKYSVYDRGLLLFSILVFSLFILGYHNSRGLKPFLSEFSNKAFLLPFSVTATGILFWLFTAPGPRFAYGFLFGSLSLIASEILSQHKTLFLKGNLKKKLSKSALILGITCVSTSSIFFYDHYFGQQKFLNLLLSYYDNLGKTKLPFIFGAFIATLLLVGFLGIFSYKIIKHSKSDFIFVRDKIMQTLIIPVLLGYLLFEIPVMFSSTNERLYFPEVKLTINSTEDIETYFVEAPHLGWNKSLFSTNRKCNLYVTKENERYKFIEIKN